MSIRPWSRKSTFISHPFILLITLLLAACASVPPQVGQLHEKEREILESLRDAHLAMVDSFIDQKKQNFEHFLFNRYGPVYVENWKEAFQEVNGRPYDPESDFPQLYNDLVAVYQAESAPIEEMRTRLREAISDEYRNAILANQEIGRWMESLENLNASQKNSLNELLGQIDPDLSLVAIDEAVRNAEESVKQRVSDLNG